VRIIQHLLAYRLATALGLDAVDHRLQFLGNLDREHLAHVVTFLAPVLEPNQPPGVVGPQLPVPLEGKLARLASEHHDGDGLVVGIDGRHQRVELGVEARNLRCSHHQPRSNGSSYSAALRTQHANSS